MKIALVTNVLPPEGRGGAESYAAALAAELGRRDHDVTIMSGSVGSPPARAAVMLPRRPDVDGDAGELRKAAWHVVDLWRPDTHRAVLSALRRGAFDAVHTNSVQGL